MSLDNTYTNTALTRPTVSFGRNNWTSSLTKDYGEVNCGGCTSSALLTFLNHGAEGNQCTADSMMDTLLPFVVDLNDTSQKKIAALVMSTSRDFKDKTSLKKQVQSKAGAKALGTYRGAIQGDVKIALGGYDIVSLKRAQIHIALNKVGVCEAGYQWNAGTYDKPCDKCKKPTEEGYNCAGGGHFVCNRCVGEAMTGGGGGGGGGASKLTLYDRAKCLGVLVDLVAGGAGDMQQMMANQGKAMQKYQIDGTL